MSGVTSTFAISVDTKHKLNLPEDPCVEDESYSLSKCLTDYVTKEVGCKSPWDAFPDDMVPTCSSLEEMSNLFASHRNLNSLGGSLMRNLTQCHPKCSFDDYEITQSTVSARQFKLSSDLQFTLDNAAIAVQLGRSSKTIIRQSKLYHVSSLVGEVGGSLGMFLGASLITLYEVLMDFLRHTMSVIKAC